MASYQTLDIAVKISGEFGKLDRIAEKLDTIHRKAQKVRDNNIGFDVDGDAESIARSEAVEQSLKDTAGTYNAHIETSGGYDTSNQVNAILTDLGELQGKNVELASRLDFDESYINDSLDNIRENLRGKTVEDLSDADIREFGSEIEDARERYRRLGTELYVDTSQFEDDVSRIRAQLHRALSGEDTTFRRDIDVSYGTQIDPEELFDTLNAEIESATIETEVDLRDVELPSVEDISRSVHTEFTSDEPQSIEDTQRLIEQRVDEIDDSVLEDVSRDIHQSFEGEEPPVEDLTRTITTVFSEYDVPHIGDEHRTVYTDFEDTEVPSSFEDLRASINSGELEHALDTIRRLKQQFASLDRPALEQRADTFSQTLERTVDGDVSLQDDVVQSQLRNLEHQLYEIHPTVEIEPDVEIDTSAIDVDLFSERLHELGTEVAQRREFFADMGVDPEETYERLGSLSANITADIESGELDASSVVDYREEMSSLQRQLHNVADVSRRVEQITDSVSDLGETIREYRVNRIDLTQSLERESFRSRIEEADERLQKTQHAVVKRLDPEATYTEDEGFQTDVDLADNDVYRRLLAMRTALAALDDTVAEPEVHIDDDGVFDAQLEQRLRAFQELAEQEGQLFASDDRARNVLSSFADVDSFETTLREHPLSLSAEEGLFSDLSSVLQQSFDADEIDIEPLEHEQLGRSRSQELWDRFTHTVIGPQNIVRARGENAFEKEDFIGETFSVDDLIDSDSSFSAQDIFDYEGRELTDVFESERTFRAYMNPDTDVDLGDALRSDRSLSDIAPDTKGLRKQLSTLGDIDMSTFYDAAAKAVPMLLTFVGSIPAAVGGLLAVGGAAFAAAGVLGAIGALSIGGLALSLGDGNLQEGLKEIQSTVIEDARSAFTPLARRFEDLGMDALDGVGRFFDRLAAEGAALTELEDEARSFGEWVFNNTPEAIDDIVALAQAFTPLFAQGGEWLETTDIVGAFVDQAEKSLPAILLIVDAFLMMLPVIMDFSTGMLHATAVIFKFWSVVWGVIDALGPMAEGLGFVIGLGLSLYTTVVLLNWAMGAFSTIMGSSVIGTLWSYAIGMSAAILTSSTFGGILSYLASTALVSFVSSMLSSIPILGSYITASTMATVATYGLAAAIAATGIGALLVGVGLLSSQFMGTSESIQEATQSLKDFEDMRSSMGGEGIDNPYGPLEHGDMTNIDPNAPTKSGVQGEAVVEKTEVTNNNSTEIKVPEKGTKDPHKLKNELDHYQFKQSETSSDPY